MYVYSEFIVPLENFSLIWRRQHCRWRAENFELYSTLMAIEQWGFSNVPHLLWNELPFLMVISDTRDTHTCCRVLAVELSLPVFTTYVCRNRGSYPDLPHTRRTLYLIIIVTYKRIYDDFIVSKASLGTFIQHIGNLDVTSIRSVLVTNVRARDTVTIKHMYKKYICVLYQNKLILVS